MKLRKQLRDLVKEIKELEAKGDIQFPHNLLTAATQEEIQNMTDSVEVLSVNK